MIMTNYNKLCSILLKTFENDSYLNEYKYNINKKRALDKQLYGIIIHTTFFYNLIYIYKGILIKK